MTELDSDDEIVRGKIYFGLQKMQRSNDQHIYCQSYQNVVASRSIQNLKPHLQMHE